VLGLSLQDNVKSHRILADGRSERIVRGANDVAVRSQQTLLELAGAIKVLGTQVQRSGLLIALDCYLNAT
jgi:hypothetical protein